MAEEARGSKSSSMSVAFGLLIFLGLFLIVAMYQMRGDTLMFSLLFTAIVMLALVFSYAIHWERDPV